MANSSFKRFLLCLLLVCLFVPLAKAASLLHRENFNQEREKMVEEQIIARGVKDPEVISAMRIVPRHLFVPSDMRPHAYEDRPLPIGFDQTISQPYIVAYMTEAVGVLPTDRVLEIGTGSGYQAAILAEIAKDVYTIEIVEGLAKESQARLKEMGYRNITAKHGDGYKGWEDQAPFDVIVVTAAPPQIPQALVDQLAEGGRMIVPVGSRYQELVLVTKTEDGVSQRRLLPVRFVPMVEEQ